MPARTASRRAGAAPGRRGARALGLEYEGNAAQWSQKALFIGLTLLPIAYHLIMIWAWLSRVRLPARSGAFGLFSLWLLTTTLAAASVILGLVPGLVGAPLGTLAPFQPDVGAVLVGSAVTGVVWADFRLAVACSGRFLRP